MIRKSLTRLANWYLGIEEKPKEPEPIVPDLAGWGICGKCRERVFAFRTYADGSRVCMKCAFKDGPK
jgi:hypothetical protein